MVTRLLNAVILLSLAAGLALSGLACGSACEDLANKICDCQPTRTKEDSCKISISSAVENYDISSGQDDACQKILDSGGCTCEALKAGDLAACGLANDATTVFE